MLFSWIHNLFSKRTAKYLAGIFLAVFLLFFLVMPFAALAQNTDMYGLQPVEKAIALSGADIRLIIAKVIRAVLGLLGIIALAIMLYAGFVIMTSQGNEEKINQGKRILINGVIGLAIILSAFAIVQFVINSLIKATGIGAGEGEGISKPPFETFIGSGALGRVIKDHYPERNQTNVPRNTKIVVTFADSIIPESIIENTNNTCWGSANSPVPCDSANDKPYYGDCKNTGAGFDWEKDCDQLKTSTIQIYRSGSAELAEADFSKAAAMTTYDAQKNVYTFVFKPLVYLGSDKEDVWQTVKITNKVKKKVGDEEVGIFEGRFSDFYLWEFQTNTTLDFIPPFVEDVYPFSGKIAPRNTIVQINFSEPVDPMMVQGVLGVGGAFDKIIFKDTSVKGEWKIANGYKSAEFVSSEECGTNSCGEKMYCLPVVCANPDDKKCSQEYEVLAKTAQLLSPDKFESIPFSGVMDMAGNALDGNNNGKPEGKPTNGDFDSQQKKPDNYYWGFKIQNKIDRTAPYIEKVTPGIDQEGVSGDDILKIDFSKRMWLGSLASIGLEEYPPNYCYEKDKCLDDIAFHTSASLFTEKTLVTIKHRVFGPNGTALYYFPSIPSIVKSVNQNCLYPGRGPYSAAKGSSSTCVYEEDEDNVPIPGTGADCAPVNNSAPTDTGCVQTTNENLLLQPNVSVCTSTLETPGVSPMSSGG